MAKNNLLKRSVNYKGLKEEKKIPLYLEDIVDDFSFDYLPANWQGFDFGKFSQDKTLFDFQRKSLQNALKALYLF